MAIAKQQHPTTQLTPHSSENTEIAKNKTKQIAH